MKIIKYKVQGFNGTLHDAKIFCENDAILEANISVAQREAYNGEYTIVEDTED